MTLRTLDATDADLWHAMRTRASRDAFAQLFTRHADHVYNYCFRRLANWTAAEEATQATFLSIWQRTVDGRLDALRTESPIGLILWQARLAVADHARATNRRLRLVTPAPLPDDSSHSPIDEWVESESVQQRINAAMASIPDDQRDVVELVCWSDVPLADAAVALGIPLNTVKSRLARARAALREHPALATLKGVNDE